MWNQVQYVAVSQFLPEPELVAFAIENTDKYSIDREAKTNVPYVGTWYVDAMLKDFRAAFPELCERTRAEKIAAMKERSRLELECQTR